MNGVEKILPEHRQRRAFVYARQSTHAQLVKHHTSTERQLGLTAVAAQLGWAPTQVEVVATDLGRSGRFSDRDVGRGGYRANRSELRSESADHQPICAGASALVFDPVAPT